jgi:hypothetical protein
VFLLLVLGLLSMVALVLTSVVLLFTVTVSSAFGQGRVDGAGENAEGGQARNGGEANALEKGEYLTVQFCFLF